MLRHDRQQRGSMPPAPPPRLDRGRPRVDPTYRTPIAESATPPFNGAWGQRAGTPMPSHMRQGGERSVFDGQWASERARAEQQYRAEQQCPTSAGEIRSFVGMCQFYRNWIVDFSTKAAPLTDLLRKDVVSVKRSWGEKQQVGFEGLKAGLQTYPCLRQPDTEKPFTILCDVSRIGVGSCLAQMFAGEDGVERLCPISFHSHRLTDTERGYSVTDLEALAMVHAFRHNRHFLWNNPCTVRVFSDHRPLQWMGNVHARSGRCQRFFFELSDYDFQVEWIPGSSEAAHVGDALSRLLTAQSSECTIIDRPEDAMREAETGGQGVESAGS